MNDEDLEELADKILSNEVTEVPLYKLYPFLSRHKLEEIVAQMIEKNEHDHLMHVLPFVSANTIHMIREKISEGKLEGFDESHLLPFMSPNEIKDLFYSKLKETKKEE
jgi:hypothetical protein